MMCYNSLLFKLNISINNIVANYLFLLYKKNLFNMHICCVISTITKSTLIIITIKNENTQEKEIFTGALRMTNFFFYL